MRPAVPKEIVRLGCTVLLLAACSGEVANRPRPARAEANAARSERSRADISRYIGITLPSATRQWGKWVQYSYDLPKIGPAGPACLAGETYQVDIRRGVTNKILLYLEGGGACWDALTCWRARTAKLTAGSAWGGGILDSKNAANPFRDWHVVYAPYCDGSVFSGDNVTQYEGRRTYHHGLQNLSAAVSLAQREFPDPDLLVIGGTSAGAYGTFMGYRLARMAFPKATILIFNDSGPGLEAPDDAAATALRKANWNYMQDLPADCPRCREEYTAMWDWALQRDPALRVASFSYLHDAVLRAFLNVGAAQFEELLLAETGRVHAAHPGRFKRFYPRGNGHSILQDPDFYRLSLGNTSLAKWTAAFLANAPAWRDLVATNQ
jgi:hypothetical protein